MSKRCRICLRLSTLRINFPRCMALQCSNLGESIWYRRERQCLLSELSVLSILTVKACHVPVGLPIALKTTQPFWDLCLSTVNNLHSYQVHILAKSIFSMLWRFLFNLFFMLFLWVGVEIKLTQDRLECRGRPIMQGCTVLDSRPLYQCSAELSSLIGWQCCMDLILDVLITVNACNITDTVMGWLKCPVLSPVNIATCTLRNRIVNSVN